MENEKEPVRFQGKGGTRLQKSMREALNWALIALLAFGLGALLITLALYRPTRQRLASANTDLEQTNATITSQNNQITALETEIETLQDDLDSATLHMYVLDALAGARGASRSAAEGNYAGTRLSLDQTSTALAALSDLLGPNHNDVITAMQTSAAQASTKADRDLESAQSDLDQLTKNLVQLEDNLFPNP